MLRSAAAAIVLAAVATLTAGCSSADSSEDPGNEGALTDGDAWKVDVHSAKEAAGEVEPGNVYAMARLAKLAYDFKDKASLEQLLHDNGIQFEEVFDFHAERSFNPLRTSGTTGTDGFYMRTKDAGFLVFRGTEPGKIADIIADARVLPTLAGPIANPAGRGVVHAGFYHALHAIWDKNKATIKDRHGDGHLPLYVVGHSLGGALGTIATHHLLFDGCLDGLLDRIDVIGLCTRKFVPVRALYTFGSPRTGDEKYATNLVKRMKDTKTALFRFVNEEDGVTMIPNQSIIPGYRHLSEDSNEAATAILLSKDGQVTPHPENRCPQSKNPLVQCDRDLLTVAGDIIGGTPPWKGEHPMKIYLEKTKILATGKGDIEKIRAELEAAANQ